MTTNRARRLFILDGMALAYRAHFAFINNPMRNSQGMNVSAVFGFANTLVHIIEHENPTHLVACFDAGKPTYRHELYAEYKANREAMPEELRAQIPVLLEFLVALNIPVLRIEGFEADDTIGTLTRMASETGQFATYMVSQDKDLGQLIDNNTYLWKPGKRNNDHEIVDLPKLKEHWGIEKAEQVIDILALMGDSSDNIPGLPGIGEKTAKLLIEEFGSVENLLAHTEQLKGKCKQIVEQNAHLATLSKELATINRYVPIKIQLHDLERKPPIAEQLNAVFRILEFRNLQTKLLGKAMSYSTQQQDLFTSVPATSPTMENTITDDLFAANKTIGLQDISHDYRMAQSPQEVLRILKDVPLWSFSAHLKADLQIDGIAFCCQQHQALYLPITSSADLSALSGLFAGNSLKISYHIKPILNLLRRNGLDVQGPFFDTLLATALLQPHLKHDKNQIIENNLHYSLCLGSHTKNPSDQDSGFIVNSECEQADCYFRLLPVLKKQISQQGMSNLLDNVELPLIRVLSDMELCGIRILPQALQQASVQVAATIDTLAQKIESVAGHDLNLNSPKQLGDFLFGELKLVNKPKKTKTGQFVTDEETLLALVPEHPIVSDILAYRENTKLKTTYLDALPRYICPEDGKIHTQFNQLMTATGRLASMNPNLQNIPIRTEQGRLIRAAFVPSTGRYTLLSADYSQIELRIMAALSGDEKMCTAFREQRDIHTETAAHIFHVNPQDVTTSMRRSAKTVNFGIIYGISAFGLSQRLQCSRKEAASLIDNYFAQFPKVRAFMETLVERAEQQGFASTLSGRRRPIPDINSANRNMKAAANRIAINTPIQGTAADMIKLAMLRVHNVLQNSQSHLVLQIHDELIVDLHLNDLPLIERIKTAMINALPLPNNVPVSVEARTGDNWLQAH